MRAENDVFNPSRSPGYKPVKQHHTARHYADRVKESLSTSAFKNICATFVALVVLLGLIALIIWLSVRPYRPRFHVQEFTIPGLAQRSGPENVLIIYTATARNANRKSGIYYDSVYLAVYYGNQRVGGAPLSPFYQKPKSTKVLAGQLSGADLTVSTQQWNQFKADSGKGEVVFRCEITANVRYRTWSWNSRRRKVGAKCPVGVGLDGLILPKYKDNSKSSSKAKPRVRKRIEMG